MGISPRVVTEDVRFLWDGVSARLPKGQVIDVAPGSPLEAAIGAGRLVPMPGTAPQPPTEAAPAEAPQDGEDKPWRGIEDLELPAEPAAPAKKQDSAKEGDS